VPFSPMAQWFKAIPSKFVTQACEREFNFLKKAFLKEIKKKFKKEQPVINI
jgi:hypothetical protein